MKFTIHVKDEKAPFFLELIQNLGFAKIDKMESASFDEMEDLQKMVGGLAAKKNSSPPVKNTEVTNLQSEIDDFFGQ